jgi:hypothetical protein
VSKDRVVDQLTLETYWEDLQEHEFIEEVLISARKAVFAGYGLPTIAELEAMARSLKKTNEKRKENEKIQEYINKIEEEHYKQLGVIKKGEKYEQLVR